jgi:hypothetical protein
MTTATCLGARKANMKAYVVVIASTKTRQSKMGCMLRGGVGDSVLLTLLEKSDR